MDRTIRCLALAALALPALASAATVDGTIVLADDDDVGGNPVSIINQPFVTASGAVGFAADTTANDDFVWLGSGPVWSNSDSVSPVLSGIEGSIGVADPAKFIYSPSIDGEDGVWTHNGLLQVKGAQALGYPVGTNSTFNSRPYMTAGGTAYWISGLDPNGGTTSSGRALMKAADGDPLNAQVVLDTDDLIGGVPLSSSGIGFDYWVSDNEAHQLLTLDLETGSTTDDAALLLDGVLLAQEASPIPGGVANWDNFDLVMVNDSGSYCFSGDDDGATTTDEFIYCDGAFFAREGDVVAGATLGSSVRFASLTNAGQLAWSWDTDIGEAAFLSCDPSQGAAAAELLLSVGDELDIDGDGIGDFTVTDFNQSTTFGSNGLTADGTLYLEVDLNDGLVDREAMIAIDASCCAADNDGDGVCDVDDQCLGDDASGDDDGDGICNDLDFTLEISEPVQANGTITMSIVNGVAGTQVQFFVSSAGFGAKPCLPNGTCGDLDGQFGRNLRSLASATTGPDGAATATFAVPSTLPAGVTLSFQAVFWDGVSGDFTQVIQTVTGP